MSEDHIMNDKSQNGYISTNAVTFAQSVIGSLEDMVGDTFVLNKSSFKEIPFSSPFNMTAYIHFSGTIQGDYIFSLDEITAAKLIDVYESGMPEDDLREMREDYGGFVKELLNLAVGQSILELEQSFGYLTYTPGTVIYGEVEFPDVTSGTIMIENEKGGILCGFSLNLAQVKIGRKLEETLQELEKKTVEANRAAKEVEGILRLIPSGLVAINSDAKILPGHSRSTAAIVGYDSGKDIVGSDLATLLSLDPDTLQNLIKWVHQVFLKQDSLSFEELVLMCENEFTNQRGKILKLDWLPVTNDESGIPEKLLIIIQDFTEKRRLEAENEKLKSLKFEV